MEETARCQRNNEGTLTDTIVDSVRFNFEDCSSDVGPSIFSSLEYVKLLGLNVIAEKSSIA